VKPSFNFFRAPVVARRHGWQDFRAMHHVALGQAAVCAGLILASSAARAQDCESARPTDSAGAAGLSYGAAEVAHYDSASGRARVHYALSGTHAPPRASTLESGIPDAVLVAATAADDAFAKYDELGYAPVMSDADSPCTSNGGSDAVDIYLLHFAAADGQAVPDHCEPGPPRRCAGFVLVENDFRNGGYTDTAEGLRTVVPHELFHLVQNAYDAELERWWAEGSAQWAAKRVYPELTDLERFLPAYFDNPWRPLNVPPSGPITSFLYATAIWPVFLSERWGVDIVREIHEALAEEPAGAFAASAEVLQRYDSTLPDEFLRFAAYNAATAERAPDSGGYEHAVSYPPVEPALFVPEPGAEIGETAAGLNAFYYSVTAASSVRLQLSPSSTRVAGLLLPLVNGKAELAEQRLLPATLTGEGIVVITGQSLERTDAPFLLQASDPAATDDGDPEASGCALAGGRASAPGSAYGAAIASMLLLRARRRRCGSRKDA
jgi:hypothetical protein